MTSSRKPGESEGGGAMSTKLPPALPSMWRLCKLGYRHEPRLMTAAFVLSLLGALPDALLALWLMLLGKGVLERSLPLVLTASIGLGLSADPGMARRRRHQQKVATICETGGARRRGVPEP